MSPRRVVPGSIGFLRNGSQEQRRERAPSTAVQYAMTEICMTSKLRSSLHVAAAMLLLTIAATGRARAADTIKVGILHSLPGTMAISETILKNLMLWQVTELNAQGGLLGKKVVPVVVDPASNWPLFAEKARELISQDHVAVVFGCWTSVSRKSVLPVFKELNNILL